MTINESSNMKFAIGDKVVHPQHGVGLVAGLEEKQFEPSAPRMYYVISIPDTTLWVPVDFSSSGLRKLSLKSDIEECRKILQDTPQVLTTGRELMASLSSRIKEGKIIYQCEVVRDLTAFTWKKPLYGALAEFQRMIMNVLCQEWAEVNGLSLAVASSETNGLLKIGRASSTN